jgi:hypothetical protein
MPTEITAEAQVVAEEKGAEHLRRGALTLFDGTVIGVSSTAPAYSLTATVAQFWTGIGAMLIGIPLLAWSWYHNPSFYGQPTEAAGPEEEVRAEPVPAGTA